MLDRSLLKALLFAGILLPLASCATSPSLSLITVTPATMNFGGAGLTTQLTATGTYTEGKHPATTLNITNGVTWVSSSPECVTVSSTGLITSGTITCSNIQVTASAPGFAGLISGSMTVNVTQTTTTGTEPVVSLVISPASYSELVGQTAFFKAYGTSSAGTQIDLTSQVTWSVLNPQVATIDATTGAATAVGPGSTQINAVWTNPDKTIVPATSTLTVTGASSSSSSINGLSIIPGSQSIALPETGSATVNLVVIGTNATGLQSNQSGAVTWVSSNPAVLPTANIVDGASFAAATVIGPGTTTLTASFTNVTSATNPVASVATTTATITATAPTAEPLLSIAINPSSPSVPFPGQTDQLTAIGTNSVAPFTQNMTGTVTWSSSNPAIATVCNAVATTTAPIVPASCVTTPGLVTGVGQGTVAITAATLNPDKSLVYMTVPFTVTAGSAETMTALTIIPGALSLSATGQPGTLTALGTNTITGLQEDVTASPQITWTSTNPTIATVCTAAQSANPAVCPLPVTPGEVIGVSASSTNITAEYTNTPATLTTTAQVVTAQAGVNVSTTPAAEPLLSIAVLPSSTTDLNLLGTAQFLAYGTFSTAPTALDITNGFFHAGFPTTACTAAYAAADAATAAADSAANLPLNNLPDAQCSFVPVNWISTAPYIFPVNSAGTAGATGGLSTAYGSGNTNIYVVAANPDSTLVYSPMSTFNCPYAAPTYGTTTVTVGGVTTTTTDYNDLLNPGTCNALTVADSLLSTLTVFNAGVNTTNWLITAPSATGTVDVIHCGGSTEQATVEGSVCTATYPNGTTLTLTAPTETGVKFGGWSSSCNSTNPVIPSQTGPNTCTVIVGGGCTVNVNTQAEECTDSSNVTVGAIFN